MLHELGGIISNNYCPRAGIISNNYCPRAGIITNNACPRAVVISNNYRPRAGIMLTPKFFMKFFLQKSPLHRGLTADSYAGVRKPCKWIK